MSKNLAFCALAIIVLLISVVRSATPGGCSAPGLFEAWSGDAALPASVVDAGDWYQASLGWILAPGNCAARDVALEMEAASAAFERHFGIEAPAGAVFDVAHARHASVLKESGAAWVLPWRFDAATGADDPRSDAIRAQIRSQLTSNGQAPEPDRVEVMVQQALAQLGEIEAPSQPPLEPKAIRHEIAHLLFTSTVWPSTQERSAQYGGDAPDWLDEAAAVVAESADMTEARRQVFEELVGSGRTIPLDEYLHMPHPVFAGGDFSALLEQARERAEADGAAVVSASLPSERIELARAFYAQTRGFVDHLIQKTGDERILYDIARSMRDGKSFQQWLATEGHAAGLPGELDALEQEILATAIDDQTSLAR